MIQLEISEEPYATHGYLDLDNTDGALAGPPSPFQLGNLVKLGFGYQTSSGALSSQIQDLQVSALSYRRPGGVSVLPLALTGVFEHRGATWARTSVYHDARDARLQPDPRPGSLTVPASGYRCPATRRSLHREAGVSDRADDVSPCRAAPGDGVPCGPSLIAQAGNIVQLTEPLTSDTTDYTLAPTTRSTTPRSSSRRRPPAEPTRRHRRRSARTSPRQRPGLRRYTQRATRRDEHDAGDRGRDCRRPPPPAAGARPGAGRFVARPSAASKAAGRRGNLRPADQRHRAATTRARRYAGAGTASPAADDQHLTLRPGLTAQISTLERGVERSVIT